MTMMALAMLMTMAMAMMLVTIAGVADCAHQRATGSILAHFIEC